VISSTLPTPVCCGSDGDGDGGGDTAGYRDHQNIQRRLYRWYATDQAIIDIVICDPLHNIGK
jgi:hypothetical protein